MDAVPQPPARRSSAYNGVFSLGALLLIAIAVAGWFFVVEAVRGPVTTQAYAGTDRLKGRLGGEHRA